MPDACWKSWCASVAAAASPRTHGSPTSARCRPRISRDRRTCAAGYRRRSCRTTSMTGSTRACTRAAHYRVVTDVGQHQMWAAQLLDWRQPAHATSPAAAPARWASPCPPRWARRSPPDETVWVVVGDGGFQMTNQEIATIAQEGLTNVKIAIVNNGYLGMVRQWQELFEQPPLLRHAAHRPRLRASSPTPTALIGITVHARRRASTTPSHAPTRHRTCVVIDFRVEREANVFPMVPPGKSIGEMIPTSPPPERSHSSSRLPVFLVFRGSSMQHTLVAARAGPSRRPQPRRHAASAVAASTSSRSRSAATEVPGRLAHDARGEARRRHAGGPAAQRLVDIVSVQDVTSTATVVSRRCAWCDLGPPGSRLADDPRSGRASSMPAWIDDITGGDRPGDQMPAATIERLPRARAALRHRGDHPLGTHRHVDDHARRTPLA